MCLDQGPLGWQCSSRVSSSLPPPFRWHFDVSSTLAGLSQTPTIKPQPQSLVNTGQKMFLPSLHLWPHSQANPAPGRPAHSKAPHKPSVGRCFPPIPLPCNASGEELHREGTKALHPRLSSLLLLSFWCSSSYLWTAACLINDNILVFFRYCYIPQYLYYS